jgi:hypothetical protein
MVIAYSLDDYKERQLAGKVATAVSPIVKGAADAINKTIPGVGGHAPDAPSTSPTQETKNQAYDAGLLQIVGNQIVDYLHTQYTDLAEAVDDVVEYWKIAIEKLKEEAPKEPNSLLSQLGDALLKLTAAVFPELEVVKVVVEVKEIADKGQESDKQAAEAARTKRVFASKMQAMEALAAFSKEVKLEAKNARSALEMRVRAAIVGFQAPPDFYQTIAKDFDKYVGQFAVEKLAIRIGTDQDPGVIKKVQASLSSEIGKWLKQQYVAEHETEAVLKSPAGRWVSYGAFTAEQVQKRVQDYLKENPDQKEEIDQELRGEYTKEFKKKVLGLDE